MINIRKLEAELWESADLLRAGSKLTSNQYCMPVLGLIFLRYAYSRFKLVEAEILKDRPVRLCFPQRSVPASGGPVRLPGGAAGEHPRRRADQPERPGHEQPGRSGQ